jgi:drug/metabolite transporter (DMT)-like permease
MAAAVMAVVVWGLSSALIKQIEGLSGLGIACYRVWFGAVVVTALFLGSGRRITRELLRLSLLGGLAFTADLVLFFSAVQETTVANATILGALQPLLVLGIAGRMFGEPPRAVEIGWGAVAVGGTALVVLGGDGGGAASRHGDLLAVGALVAWTLYFVASKTARLRLTSFEYLTGMAIVAAVAIVPLPFLFEGTIGTTDTGGWLSIVFLALFNGLLGHFFMSYSHGHVTLLAVSLLTLGIPVIATAVAALWLDESLTLVQVGGMVVVLAALSLVSWSTARRAPALVADDARALEAAPHP